MTGNKYVIRFDYDYGPALGLYRTRFVERQMIDFVPVM